MKQFNAIYKNYVQTTKRFAWKPVTLTNGNTVWFSTYYEEMHLLSNGFGPVGVTSGYYTRDEYIMRKLSGVE